MVEGNKLALREAWELGDYTAESVEGTAQQNAKALGKSECYADVSMWLESVGVEDDQDGGIPDTDQA